LPGSSKITLFLAVFRGFAYIVAAIQIVFLSSLAVIPSQTYLLLGLVGAYTIAKILIPFRWYQKDYLTYLILGADVLVCVSLLFLTGGLASGFLLYSLNPILTISLIMHRRVALSVAGFSSLAVIGSQLFSSRIGLITAPIIASEYLSILIIYIIVCFLAAFLPFFINANVHRHIEEKATVDERNRLAVEMHDNLAQNLGYFKLKTKLVKDSLLSGDTKKATAELNDLKLVADDVYEDIRESIDLLRSKKLDSIGLIPTLADYLHQFGQRSGIRTELLVVDGQTDFSPLAELQLMRVLQEALINVRRHANARKVEVRFEADGNWTQVSIGDDGQGFDPATYQQEEEEGHHIGLKVMRERAESLGGNMSITSDSKLGTKIFLKIPTGKG